MSEWDGRVEPQVGMGGSLSGQRLRIAVFVGLVTVTADLWLVWLRRYPVSFDGRWALALASLSSLVWLCQGDPGTIGLRSPKGGWRRWLWLGILLGLVVLVFIGVAAGLWVATGRRLPLPTDAPDDMESTILHMCVFSPFLEETLYRVVLCVPLVALANWKWAVAASGTTFALLHFVYGNPSPENMLGGFLLAWAFVRSGSVCVPLLLHAVGNLLVLVAQIGIWQWTSGHI